MYKVLRISLYKMQIINPIFNIAFYIGECFKKKSSRECQYSQLNLIERKWQMDLLLSIKYKYIQQIELNNKQFEIRKKIYKKQVEYIYVHSSMRQKNIVGRFKPIKVIKKEPESIWNEFHSRLGVSEVEFQEYASNCQFLYLIQIDSYEKPLRPVELEKVFERYQAPQMFKYLSQNESNLLQGYF